MWSAELKIPRSVKSRMIATPGLDLDWQRKHLFVDEALSGWGPVMEIRSGLQGQCEVWLHFANDHSGILNRLRWLRLTYLMKSWQDFLSRCEGGGPYPPVNGVLRRICGVTLATDKRWKDDHKKLIPQLKLKQTGWSWEEETPRIEFSEFIARATFEEFRAWLALLDRVCQMLNETTTAASDETG